MAWAKMATVRQSEFEKQKNNNFLKFQKKCIICKFTFTYLQDVLQHADSVNINKINKCSLWYGLFQPFLPPPWTLVDKNIWTPQSVLDFAPMCSPIFLGLKKWSAKIFIPTGPGGFLRWFSSRNFQSHSPWNNISYHRLEGKHSLLQNQQKNNYSNIFNQNLVLDGGRVFFQKNAPPVKRERSGSHCVRSPSLLQVTLHAQSPPASFRASVEISGWLQWLSRWIWWGYDGDRVYVWSKPPNPGCQRKVKVLFGIRDAKQNVG